MIKPISSYVLALRPPLRRLGSPSLSMSQTDPQEESSNFRNKLVLKSTQLEVTIGAENDYSRQMNTYMSTLEINNTREKNMT